MAYKVFFAFQMDTDDKFGKGFIHVAIDIAIQKFASEGIDVSLDFGFRGTPGTPLLIEEMLRKSSEADMVIVDLTFTSSKAWHESKKWKVCGKEIRFLEIKSDKKSSNPNVLLETGYAWAKKGTYRTLVVMNEAFGSPDELPVDLKGFRWGITYNLNEKTYDKRKEVRKQLANDLYIAIKAAIKSEVKYQNEKWKPIYVKSEWDTDHSYPYFLTEKLKTKILEFRNLIEKNKGNIRLTGLKDTGKTRLVNEVFKSNGVDLVYNDKNEIFLYYDLDGPLKGDISKQLYDLKLDNQDKFLILDNCTKTDHDKYELLFRNTKVRLISIDTVSSKVDTDFANIFLDDDISSEIYEKILDEKFDSIGIQSNLTGIKLGLSKTITFLENQIGNQIGNKTITELLKIIIEEENLEKGALEFLMSINLFDFVGVSGRFNMELETIKSVLLNNAINPNVDIIIQKLISKKLLLQKGDFLSVSGFEKELSQSWWSTNKESLNQIIEKLEGTGLLIKFISRLQLILSDEDLAELKKLLFDENSILVNDEFTNTPEGSELLNKLANDFPVEVLNVLIRKIE